MHYVVVGTLLITVLPDDLDAVIKKATCTHEGSYSVCIHAHTGMSTTT